MDITWLDKLFKIIDVCLLIYHPYRHDYISIYKYMGVLICLIGKLVISKETSSQRALIYTYLQSARITYIYIIKAINGLVPLPHFNEQRVSSSIQQYT